MLIHHEPCSIYQKDILGRTPLHLAAAAGNIHAIEALVGEATRQNNRE